MLIGGRLDRYVLREFLHYLAMALLLFVGLFVLVDLFDRLDKFVDGSAKVLDVAAYYVYGVPFILVLVTPIAMLLACLLALGQIGRNGELVAMMSGGISYFRILLPILAFSVVVSVATFALAELVMPGASVAQESVYQERIRGGPGRSNRRERNVTYVGRGDRLFYIKTVDARRRMLRDVVVQRFDAGGDLVGRIDAREAEKHDDTWVFRSGFLRAIEGEIEHVAPFRVYRTTSIPEAPDDFLRIEPAPANMSRAGLAGYIRRLRESRARTRTYEVEYHLKLAVPLVNLIIVLLGTGLSIRLRRPGLAQGFGLSIFIGFAYVAFVRAGQAMGYNGLLPPLVAAWLGNAVFFVAAAALTFRLNR